jgi:hypothetical protein
MLSSYNCVDFFIGTKEKSLQPLISVPNEVPSKCTGYRVPLISDFKAIYIRNAFLYPREKMHRVKH